jgi:hypothetical protein
MLEQLGADIWHAQRGLKVAGVGMTSRMTIVRLADGGLWLHSPILIEETLRTQLDALGPVKYIVAPNMVHHLFAKKCLAMYPQARLFGAPGLAEKRPDIAAMTTLPPQAPPEWQGQIDQVFIAGMPRVNETAFFHPASGSVIFTDVCQRWQRPQNAIGAMYAWLTGVSRQLAVPRTVRLLVKDKAAMRASVQQILAWPIQRVVVAHDSVVENDAHGALTKALGVI